MTNPLVLDGKSLVAVLEEQMHRRVVRIMEKNGGTAPVLATILVGNDPASETYVNMKATACRRVGMESLKIHLPEITNTTELLSHIRDLNQNPKIQGILLQHPAPPQIDEKLCFDTIALEKDVDGVTSHGFGRMAMGETAYGSATPAGIMKILSHYKIPLEGKHAVVVGRSRILGKPMAFMLLNQNATVTICHSKTTELPKIVGTADIVVGAVGRPRFIRGEWIRRGAVVIDAGYHPGKVGDVDLESCLARCSAYTPVPGGVGPMTIATLMEQTVDAAEKQAGITN